MTLKGSMRKALSWARAGRRKISWDSPLPIIPRKPEPREPERPSLTQLSDELIFLICNHLQDVSPESVISLASVSSFLYGKARYVQHRDETIDVRKMRDEIRYLTYLSGVDLLPAIRTLRFIDGMPSREGDKLLMLPHELLDRMTGLCEVYWDAPLCPIPSALVEYLIRRPRLRLLTSVTGHGMDINRRYALHHISSLRGSLNLYSMNVDVEYVTANSCLEMLKPLKELLLSCPNLRQLSLDVHVPRYGCVYHTPTVEYSGLGLCNGEKLPALEELEIIDYPWGQKRPDDRPLSGWDYGVVGYPGDGIEQDYWADNFDWSRLRRFAAHDASLAYRIAHKLTALEEFYIFPDAKPRSLPIYDFQATAQVLRQVPAMLECITVPKSLVISTAPITRHGSRLRKLGLTQRGIYKGWERNATSKEYLVRLRDRIPQLQELDISVTREPGKWPYDILDVLASFPRLQRLELTMPLQTPKNKDDEPAQPHLTMSTAEVLFRYLREHSTAQPPPLQKLHIHSGGPYMYTSWALENSTSFVVCRVPGNGDAAEGVLVTCPKLSKEHNEKLRRIVKGDGSPSEAELSKVDFKLALYGPMSEASLDFMRNKDPLPSAWDV